MLQSLSIRDVVLIEKLDLAFEQRSGAGQLAVLTGETGAGKSILIDALGLALGWRAEAGLLRRGARQAAVSVAFALPGAHAAHAVLDELGIEAGAELLLRRVLGGDGRSRAFVNDQPVSVALLRRLGDTLVEVQGQLEQHGLLDVATHRDALDAFAGLQARATATAEAWQLWREAITRQDEAAQSAAQARRDEEWLRHAVAELDGLAPRADEEDQLAAERQLMRHSVALGEAVAGALGDLEHGRGVLAALRGAHRQVQRQADKAAGRLDAAVSALDRALTEATEAAAQLEAARDALDFDPGRLEKIEERLFALRALARKHAVSVPELAALRATLAERLQALDGGEAHLLALAKATAAAREAYTAAAEALSQERRQAAQKLDRAVAKELAPLRLEKARFVTEVERLDEGQWSALGLDRVQFLVATNPGSTPAPIGRIASGGELARFLLALKVALAKVGTAATLIFDEVDAGVGGATAAAVGERLRRLAREVQVLVITHSPQVAALADRHFLIRKTATRSAATTEVVELDAGGRREEIARMISGAEVTAEARAAADRLLGATVAGA
jgi:DNA repair protein RecN (Recombination protein N)